MVMNESVENYLETILVLNHRLGNVRSIDIANEMNFKKPSVSVAMKNLRAPKMALLPYALKDIFTLQNPDVKSLRRFMNAIPLFQAGLSCLGLIPALQQKMHVRLNMMSAPKVLKRSNVT